MTIEPIDPQVVDLVTYTANQIAQAHGWAVTFKELEVQTILQATRLVNDVAKVS